MGSHSVGMLMPLSPSVYINHSQVALLTSRQPAFTSTLLGVKFSPFPAFQLSFSNYAHWQHIVVQPLNTTASGVFYTGFSYLAFHHIVCVYIPILANTNNYVIYLAHNVIVNKHGWSAPMICLVGSLQLSSVSYGKGFLFGWAQWNRIEWRVSLDNSWLAVLILQKEGRGQMTSLWFWKTWNCWPNFFKFSSDFLKVL